MPVGKVVFSGVVRGNTVELDRAPGLPDGQPVAVTLAPVLPKGEGIRRSFGTWADDAAELDEFLAAVRRDRHHGRSGQTR